MMEPCGAIAAACTCRYFEGDGHTVHECSNIHDCDGAWEGTEPDIMVRRLPKSALDNEMLPILRMMLGPIPRGELPYTDESGVLDV